MRAFDRIVKAIDPGYAVLLKYNDTELPLDAFFCRQVDRVGRLNDAPPKTDVWFSGTAITSFEGRLEAIDDQGPIWEGARWDAFRWRNADRMRVRQVPGEDVLNPFGNKTVCVTGRAIYTGDSQLPERLEVMTIEDKATAAEAIGIKVRWRRPRPGIGMAALITSTSDKHFLHMNVLLRHARGESADSNATSKRF